MPAWVELLLWLVAVVVAVHGKTPRRVARIAVALGVGVVLWQASAWLSNPLISSGYYYLLSALAYVVGGGVVVVLWRWIDEGYKHRVVPMSAAEPFSNFGNINTTGQTGGTNRVDIRIGAQPRQLAEGDKQMLVENLKLGTVVVEFYMNDPDGQPFAEQIATFLRSKGYTVELATLLTASTSMGVGIKPNTAPPSVRVGFRPS